MRLSRSEAGNNHFQLALEAFVQCFSHLHRQSTFLRRAQPAVLPDHHSPGQNGKVPPVWNLFYCDACFLVRAEGLEPPRVSPQEPKSCVSTNSTTPAWKPSGATISGAPDVSNRAGV
jgi:hypothetical protein